MNPEEHANFIAQNAHRYASAKSDRICKELSIKSAKAILMKRSALDGFTQIAAQEREAMADQEYIDLIKALQASIKAEETLKYEIEASRLLIDIWRTREASERLGIRAHE